MPIATFLGLTKGLERLFGVAALLLCNIQGLTVKLTSKDFQTQRAGRIAIVAAIDKKYMDRQYLASLCDKIRSRSSPTLHCILAIWRTFKRYVFVVK
jgi:hypothetical protein